MRNRWANSMTQQRRRRNNNPRIVLCCVFIRLAKHRSMVVGDVSESTSNPGQNVLGIDTVQREKLTQAFLAAATARGEIQSDWKLCFCQQSCSRLRSEVSRFDLRIGTGGRRQAILYSDNWNQPRFERRGKRTEWPLSFTTSSIGGGLGLVLAAPQRGIYNRVAANPTPAEEEASRNKLGITAALFTTYFSVMFAKCALPSTLSLLLATDSGLSFPPSSRGAQSSMARVLTLSTFSVSLGKLILGPVIDSVTGVPCLKVALFTLACCLCVIARATSFATFAIAWVLVDFVFSACWAACLNAVHGIFGEEEWPGIISVLAVAARTGNAVAFAIFGAVLGFCSGRDDALGIPGRGQPWRSVFWVSAVSQVVPFTLLSIFTRRKQGTVGTAFVDRGRLPTGNSSKSIQDSLLVLREEAKRAPFWLHLLSRSCLMIFASFLMFVPSLMTNCFGLSSSMAARAGSLYALGCLLSVSVGSKRYTGLGKRGKICANLSQLGTATLSALLLLGHVSGYTPLPPSVGVILMFLWGLSFAVPFYIPPSIFALKRGGKESSATIADAFDFCGFLCLAGFNGYVAGIQQNVLSSWTSTFCILASCSAASMVSLIAIELLASDEMKEGAEDAIGRDS